MKKWNTRQWILVSSASLILVYIIVQSSINAFHTEKAAQKVRGYLSQEIRRAGSLLPTNQWNALMVEVGPNHQITAFPCLLPATFHYPESLEELEGPTRDHLNLYNSLWDTQTISIPELEKFDEASIGEVDLPSRFPYELIREPDLAKIIDVLRNASQSLDPDLPVFGIEKGGTYSWEVHTFHLSGPPIPPPSSHASDVQVLSRLLVHAPDWTTRNDGYRGIRDRLYFEDGSVAVVDLNLATDETIDLLRDVPNLAKLLANLRTIDLKYASISRRSLNFLKKELPHVKIASGND